MLKLLQAVRKRTVLSIAIFVGLVAGFWFACGILSPSRDLQIGQLRQRGFPVTLRELNNFYPALEAKQNAAVAYARCFSTPLFLSPNTNDAAAKKWLPLRGEPLGKEAAQEMCSLLSKNEEAFRILHTTTGPARYDIDLRVLPKLELLHHSKIKYGVSLLSNEALFRAGNHDANGAVEALLASQELADSLLMEPLIVSCRARYADFNSILRRLERVMSLVQLNEDQLLRLEASIARAENNEHQVRALAGTTALILDCFLESKHQSRLFNARYLDKPTLTESLQHSAELSSLKLTGYFAKDRRFFLDSMISRIVAAELPFPQRFVVGSAVATNLPSSQFLIFSRMLLPGLGNLPEQDARHFALLRAARTAIAIERFRLVQQGRLPVELKELVPDFLLSVPQDPFTGAPLHYVPGASNYTVYSVNSDLHDDGGLEVERNVSGPSDLIFSVKLPASDRPR